MRPIYDFSHIQVELTNACVHQCSNCTRFCGHHKKPFFMEWEIFKQAIDSLKDWPRIIGIMGGEPTLHPEFERFAEYAHNVHPEFYNIGGGIKPVKSLSMYIEDVNQIKGRLVNKKHGLGLWTSACATYAKYFEIIQENFIFQSINDHTASSRHQAWLMTRKEFNIPDSDWLIMRDNCWWQRLLGSPSVTPKGAFFCEVAAAMDILFDGPGGWKIEKGWWKRSAEDFGEQLMWCEYCSGAFTDFERDANEERDDVSPLMYNKLQKIGSPKVRKNKIVVHSVSKTNTDIHIKPRQEILQYQSESILRVTEKNRYIHPNNIAIIEEGMDFGLRLAKLVANHKGWITIVRNKEQNTEDYINKMANEAVFNTGALHYFEEKNYYFLCGLAKQIKVIGFVALKGLNNGSELADLWDQNKFVLLPKGFKFALNPDIDEWRNNITNTGLMRHYCLEDSFTSAIYKTTLFPYLTEIVNWKLSYKEKFEAIRKLDITDVVSSTLCSKIKTALHNIIAKELGENNFNYSKTKAELLEIHNFISDYALSTLTVGEERTEYLLKCISSSENIYGLGISTLRDHVRHARNETECFFESIFNVIKEPVVILGNHYHAKSLQMIISYAGLPPVALVDDERHGSIFNGTMTYSVPEALSKFSNYKFIMCLFGVRREHILERFHEVGHIQEIQEISKLTAVELYRSDKISEDELEGVTSIKSELFKLRQYFSV